MVRELDVDDVLVWRNIIEYTREEIIAAQNIANYVKNALKSQIMILGGIAQDDLKVSKQCTMAVNMANKMQSLISRTIGYKSK